MKKVLLIVPLSTIEWGTKNAGGVDSVCQILIQELNQRSGSKFQYRILAFDPFSKVENCGKIIKLSSHVEVVFFHANEKRWGLKLPGFISNSLRVLAQVKSFKPDVVHAHIANWLLGVTSNIKRVATLHSYKDIARKPVSRANDFLYTKLMPVVSNLYIDCYSCVGNIIKEPLSKNTNKAISVIGNPIHDAFFLAKPKNYSEPGGIKLVTCALITRRKCIHRAIHLVNVLNKAKIEASLVVIGPCTDKTYFLELKSQVNQLGVEDKIEFMGAQPQQKIVSEYKSADIGVFFSNEETFGLAPLEMLASGLPLFTTSVGILSELKQSFESLGVEYWDNMTEQQQVEAVFRLKNFDTKDSIDYVKHNFSAKNVLNAYEALY